MLACWNESFWSLLPLTDYGTALVVTLVKGFLLVACYVATINSWLCPYTNGTILLLFACSCGCWSLNVGPLLFAWNDPLGLDPLASRLVLGQSPLLTESWSNCVWVWLAEIALITIMGLGAFDDMRFF